MIPVGEWRRRRTRSIEEQILTRLPLLASLYGLLPWHVRRLTGHEWEAYRAAADEWEAEQRKRR